MPGSNGRRALGIDQRAFSVGDPIVIRAVDRKARVVLGAVPQILVRDEPQLIATYLPAGALAKRRRGDRSGGPRGRQLVRWDGGYEDRPWTRTNVLMLRRPGDAYSVWSAWDASDWRQVWWYINLEEPWRRTAIGFDSRDQELDLWAEPDLREWRWKDEDELAWATTQGRFTDAEAAGIRAEAERALERIGRREPPLDEDWSTWRPDPEWPVPTLPSTWSRYQP